MADRRVAIRLGTEGKATVVADLNDIGKTGDAAFDRMASRARRAGQDAVDAIANAERQARKLEALMPGLNPTKLDQAAGVRDGVGKSAEQSAAVFSAAYEQMERRADALRQAIDPAYAAQKRFDTEIAEARGLMAAGVLSLDDYSKRAWQLHEGLNAVTRGHVGGIKSAANYRQAMAGASYQLQDFFVQVSMGANPVQAFVVQSGQLAGQFQNVGGKAGAVASFFMGGWGIAVQAALLVLVPLVSKLGDLVTNDEKATEAAKRHAAALQTLRDAVERLNNQQATRSRNTRQGIRDDLDAAEALRLHEIRVRGLLDAQLEQARNDVAAARQTASAGGGSVPGAMFGVGTGDEAAARRRVEAIEGAIAINDRKRAEAEQAVRTGQRLLLMRDVTAATDKAAAANQRYEDTMDRLNRQFDAGRMNQNTYTRLARDAETAKQKALELIDAGKKAASAGDDLTASSVAKFLRQQMPGVHVTATTNGKHVTGSDHYKGNAIDFVPAGGMGSMTKAQVRELFVRAGIEIRVNGKGVEQLFGPGDPGHSDHFHVAWTKGKLGLDEFNDALRRSKADAREAAQAQRELDSDLTSIVGALDPARAAADAYAETLAKIDKLMNAGRLSPGEALEYRLGAARKEWARRDEEAKAQFTTMFGGGDPLGDMVANGDRQRAEAFDQERELQNVRRQNVASLADFYQQLFNGGTGSIWSMFRSYGMKVLSELLAKWTLGQGGGLGDALKSVFGLLGGKGTGGTIDTSIKFDPVWKNAAGTEYFSGGMSLVGENGPEIVSMPQGSRVTTAGETRRLLAGNDNAPRQENHYYLSGNLLTPEFWAQIQAADELAAVRGAAGGAELGSARAKASGMRRLGRSW